MAAPGKKRSLDTATGRPGQHQPSSPSTSAVNENGQGTSRHASGDEDSEAGQSWTSVSGGNTRKKQKKEAKKLAKQAFADGQIATPLFQFDASGFRNRSGVTVHDVRDMMLNILDKESHPRWLKISNKKAIRGIVCLLVHGLDPPTLGLSTETTDNLPQPLLTPTSPSTTKLPVLLRLFSHYCPTKAPGDQKRLHSVLQSLLNAPVPKNERALRDAARAKAVNSSSNRDPALYLLKPEDFLEHGYILPTYDFDISSRILGPDVASTKQQQITLPFERWQRDDGLIETPQLDYEEGQSLPMLRILGIDCEMCVTTAGSEVCRISVVDDGGKVVYNSLVKPANKVLDYATTYSGITEELLAPVVVTLEDVQRKLSELIDYDTVLVGHSLNCDLVVLKMAHPWVIDTSVIYHHTRGPPFKASLKWLAQKWLNKEIQKPTKTNSSSGLIETIGHNSEEDARAAVELVRMKMEKGPQFGEFATDSESIFERLARATDPPRKTCVVDHGNPGQWHGAKADKAVACKTDKEVVEGVQSNVDNYDFVFARLLDLSHALGWTAPSNATKSKTAAAEKNLAVSNNGSAAPALDAGELSEKPDTEEAYRRLNNQLEEIHASLPVNTALIVLSGHGDPRRVAELTAKKNRFDILFKTNTPLSTMKSEDKWMESDERALLSAVNKVREGMTFLAIKH